LLREVTVILRDIELIVLVCEPVAAAS